MEFFKRKKIIALIIMTLIIVAFFLFFVPSFFFNPSIKNLKIISIKEFNEGLVINLALTIYNNFQSVLMESGKFKIFYHDSDFAEITINSLEMKQGDNNVYLQAYVSKDKISNFGYVLSDLFSKGAIEVNYEGNINAKYLFFSSSISFKGTTQIYQISLNDMINYVSIANDKIILNITNPLISNYTISKINGKVSINNRDAFYLYSNKTWNIYVNNTNIVELNYTLNNTFNDLGNLLLNNPSLNIKLNFQLSFGNIPIPITLSLVETLKTQSQISFTVSSISYYKYPERLELLGIIKAKVLNFNIEGINLKGGSGEIYINNTHVADFRISDSLSIGALVYSRIIIFPLEENFHLVIDEFLKNSSLILNLNFIESPVIVFNQNSVSINFQNYKALIDWGMARFVIDIKPYSIIYDSSSNSLKIGFNFKFLSLKVAGLPMILESAIFSLSFNNGTLVLNQEIKGPIDFSNSSNFISEVSLSLDDPSVKPLIEDFAKTGNLLLEIQHAHLKISVYNYIIEQDSNLNIILRISPLDILDATAYLYYIQGVSGSFDLKLSISLKSKLKAENIFLKDVFMTVLTVEGEKILENFRQSINQYLESNKQYNFTTESRVTLSENMISKIIKDFFEKGETNLIILNANVTTRVGPLEVNLLLRNVTLNVVLLPQLQVYVKDFHIIDGRNFDFNFEMYLRGIDVPFNINELVGNLTDENFNMIGQIKLSNVSFSNGSFKGSGIITMSGQDLSGIAKLFLGYNATVLGNSMHVSIELYNEKYELFAERSMFIKLIPLFTQTKFNITITDLNLSSDNDIEVFFKLEILQSIIDFRILQANFNLYDELGIKLGNSTVNNLTLTSKTIYEGVAKLKLENNSRVDYVVSLIANGAEVKVILKEVFVEFSVLNQNYTATVPLNLTIQYKAKPVIVKVDAFEITYISGNEIKAKAAVSITNPYRFPITLELASINVFDSMDGKPIGNGKVSNIVIAPNSTITISDIDILVSDVSVSYVLRHYDSQTNTLSMKVNIQIVASIKAGNIGTVIEYYINDLAVRYP